PAELRTAANCFITDIFPFVSPAASVTMGHGRFAPVGGVRPIGRERARTFVELPQQNVVPRHANVRACASTQAQRASRVYISPREAACAAIARREQLDLTNNDL